MRVVSAADVASLVHDGDTVLIGGSGGGHSIAESLIVALEGRYLEEGSPKAITSVHPVGIGDEATQGVSRFAHPGMLKRIVTGTLVDSPPLEALAIKGAIEAYTLPQGALSQLMREMAAGRPGLVTRAGLHTFADPRIGGGKQSPTAKEDLVEIVELAGKEWMFYRPFHVDVCLLRGTTADEDGNVTMEQEAVFGEMLSMAQATRRCAGIVVVQVKRLARRHTLPAKQVKIPGILIDLVVVDPAQRQTYMTEYSPGYAGEVRVPLSDMQPLPMGPRKVIARRAAMELFPGAICNLGSGISTGIAMVAAEEGVLDDVVLTNEQGLIGGAPAMDVDAGAATNYAAIVDQPYQFDFYDGGGLDLAFLSFAEIDASGNVNVSRFADRVIGFGGFINISQGARKVVFSGTFTAGGLKMDFVDGHAVIVSEGRNPKLVDQVNQISYSSRFGREYHQEVVYVTERAVFRRADEGLELVEIAPGIDLEKDVIAQMGFRPRIADDLKTMDARLFSHAKMGLGADVLQRPAKLRSPRLAELDKGRVEAAAKREKVT
ncbi:MAG TPA: CoA-transferase [Methylomirabilota bacterium]|nr:CoA-transferase [Methylomirabilota bacterium]